MCTALFKCTDIGYREFNELNGTVHLLKQLIEGRKIPVFSDISKAIKYAAEVSNLMMSLDFRMGVKINFEIFLQSINGTNKWIEDVKKT